MTWTLSRRNVVGAPVDDVVYANQGSAYVFERNSGGSDNWGRVSKLVASDGVFNDQFGYSVSTSGGAVVVGAIMLREFEFNPGAGAAYLFERNEGGINNWGEIQKLTAPEGEPLDFFGYSVSVSGSTTLVGVVLDTVGFEEQGTAYYVFWRDRLELLSPTWADGMFHATVIGTPGLDFSLQISTNFVDWTTISSASLTAGTVSVSVPAPESWGVYRAVSPQAP